MHRDGIGFYTLRHVFRTVADAARDPVAIDLIMGHSDPSMGGHYREHFEDGRLRAVTEHVRAWLFGEAPDGGTAVPPAGGVPGNPVPDFCDPCDPCDPTQENVGESGVASRAQKRGRVASQDHTAEACDPQKHHEKWAGVARAARVAKKRA